MHNTVKMSFITENYEHVSNYKTERYFIPNNFIVLTLRTEEKLAIVTTSFIKFSFFVLINFGEKNRFV